MILIKPYTTEEICRKKKISTKTVLSIKEKFLNRLTKRLIDAGWDEELIGRVNNNRVRELYIGEWE